MPQQRPQLTRDLPPQPPPFELPSWASTPAKYGNLARPAPPVQPIGVSDLMSPETESLMREEDPWQRLGNVADTVYEKLFGSGKSSYETFDTGQNHDPHIPRYVTREKAEDAVSPFSMIGMPGWGPEGFYSHAENILNESKQGLFTGDQLLGMLKSKGVKDEELRWSGLADLAENTKVSREEALATLDKAPRVGEQTLTDLHENGRASNGSAKYNSPNWSLPGPHSQYREIVLTHQDPSAAAQKFRSSHFPEDNVLAHLRLNERATPDGSDKVLHSEEYQSDWANRGKRDGFKDTAIIEQYEDLGKQIAANSEKAQTAFDNMRALDTSANLSKTNLEQWRKNAAAHHEFFLQNQEIYKANALLYQQRVDLSEAYYKARSGVEPAPFVHDPRLNVTDPTITEKGKNRTLFVGKDSTAADAFIQKSGRTDLEKDQVSGTWPDLAVKRHLLEAARDPDVKHVTWTTGEQQAERYRLDKFFKRIDYNPTTNQLSATGLSGTVQTTPGVTPDKLKDHIGQELADKLLKEPLKSSNIYDSAYEEELANRVLGLPEGARDMSHSLEGGDLKVLDQGKRHFYDRIIPQTMKRLTKQDPRMLEIQASKTVPGWNQFGGGVGSTSTGSQKVWSIPMTDELRSSILKKGFPLYTVAPLMLAHHAISVPPPPPKEQ